MYFIDKEEDLIGKEIAFTDFATHGDYITVATEDGGILCFKQDVNSKICELTRPSAKKYIFHSEQLINDLYGLRIITYQEFNEYKLFLRLKEKYDKEQ